MTNNEQTENKTTALKAMVEKLDSREKDSEGYVTYLPEVQAILSELSPQVMASVVESNGGGTDAVSVKVTLRFTLERSAL